MRARAKPQAGSGRGGGCDASVGGRVGEQDGTGQKSYGACCRARRGTRGRKVVRSTGEWGDAVRGRLHQVNRYTFRGVQSAPWLQGRGEAVKMQACSAQRGSEALPVVTRLAASIGVAKSLSASSSNLLQRRSRFIHARHTAARAR